MKKHLAALLALVTAFSLAACSGKPAPAGESAAPAASAAADAGTESDGSGGVRTAGISMPTRFLERWNLDGDCLRARFEADGYNVLLTYGGVIHFDPDHADKAIPPVDGDVVGNDAHVQVVRDVGREPDQPSGRPGDREPDQRRRILLS